MTPADQATDLFDHAPCGLLSTTSSGTVTTVNDTFLEMVGAARAEVVGHYFIELLTRGSKLFYETRFMPLLKQQGRVAEVAFDVQLRDARTLSVFVNAVIDSAAVNPAVIDPAAVDTPASNETIRFAVFDATVRRHYERDLLTARRAAELSEKRVRVMQSATTSFAAADNVADVAAALSDAARAATDASHVTVYFADESGMLHPVLPAGSDGSVVAGNAATLGITPDTVSPQTEAVRLAAVVTCADATELAERFPARAASFRAARIAALTAVPIIDEGEAIGVLVCTFGRARRLESTTTDLLESLVEQSVVVRQRIRLREQIAFQALHDALTGLPNRLFLKGRLDQILTDERPPEQTVALLFVDLDGFKAVNDKLGHQGGDLVLQEVSDRLTRVVRSGDTVARLGGDEFLVICESIDQDAIIDIAERLRAAVRQPLAGEAAALPISASVGVSFYRAEASRNDVTGETLIRFADEAMYESKRAGKDRHTFVQV